MLNKDVRRRTITFVKEHMPGPMLHAARRVKRHVVQARDKRFDLKSLFTKIYEEQLWAEQREGFDPHHPFNSGPGSRGEAANSYVEYVNRFIEAHAIRSVTDLGCGDFFVGRRIARPGIHYIGVDIVEVLMKSNQTNFAKDGVEFRCLDITRDELPSTELCLVREVLQHLSNAEVAAILTKLKQYKWVIVTESQPGPEGSFKPNQDKPHGRDSRAVWNSGIVLSLPPFNLKNVELVLDGPIHQQEFRDKGRIASFLIHN